MLRLSCAVRSLTWQYSSPGGTFRGGCAVAPLNSGASVHAARTACPSAPWLRDYSGRATQCRLAKRWSLDDAHPSACHSDGASGSARLGPPQAQPPGLFRRASGRYPCGATSLRRRQLQPALEPVSIVSEPGFVVSPSAHQRLAAAQQIAVMGAKDKDRISQSGFGKVTLRYEGRCADRGEHVAAGRAGHLTRLHAVRDNRAGCSRSACAHPHNRSSSQGRRW